MQCSNNSVGKYSQNSVGVFSQTCFAPAAVSPMAIVVAEAQRDSALDGGLGGEL